MAGDYPGNRHEPTLPEGRGEPSGTYAADEISLFDLWDVLVRWRWWIGAVLGGTVLLGLAYVLIKDPEYEYSHTIEIGKRLVGEEVRPIESPKTAAAKLETNYVPAAIRAWLGENREVQWRPEIRTSVPSDADIVVLKGTGAESRGDGYRRMLMDAADRVRNDHERIVDTIRERLNVELTQATNALEGLAQEVEGLESRLARVEREEELLVSEIGELESLLKDAESSREAASLEPGGPADAMTMLMLSNEIRTARERLNQLRVRQDVGLPNRREELKSAIADRKREMDVQRGELRTIRTRIENLSQTQPLSEPHQSLRPVGAGNTTIVALSLVLGGMLGVFAAFFAEFVQSANRRRRKMDGSDAQR